MKKQCTKCRRWKPLSAFSKDAANEDGLNRRCKLCLNQAYAQRMKDPEKRAQLNTRQRERLKDPRIRARVNTQQRKKRKDPEYQAREAAQHQKRMEDPEYRANRAAKQQKRRKDPKTWAREKAKARERLREKMKDPKYRARKNTQRRERLKDPRVRARTNTRKRELYWKAMEDPKARAQLLAQQQKRQADPAFRARVSARQRKQREDPETRARLIAGNRKLREDSEYRTRTRAQQRESRRQQRVEDPRSYHERIFEQARRRRALEARAPLGCCPKGLRAMRVVIQGGRCYSCGGLLGARAHLDHILPLRFDGAEDVHNLAMQCSPCGTSKGNQIVAKWMKWKHPGRHWGEIKRELDRGARFIKQHHTLTLQEFKRAWKKRSSR